MSIERPPVPNWKQSLEKDPGMRVVETPEAAVLALEEKDTRVVFLTLPDYEEQKRIFGKLLPPSQTKARERLVHHIQPLISALRNSGRELLEVRYSDVTPTHDIAVGDTHMDDPYSAKPPRWVRILLTVAGNSTEYPLTSGGGVVRPPRGTASIHKGATLHHAPAERKGERRVQLLVDMAEASDESS